MMGVARVVFDTNVVLSALVFRHGRLAGVRRAWQDGRCTALVSQATVAELLRALAYAKFRLSSGEQRELLADYLPYCETVQMPASPPRVPVCRDPFDLPFLQLAKQGRADYLVTGDADLLGVAPEFACPIIDATTFLSQLGEGEQQ